MVGAEITLWIKLSDFMAKEKFLSCEKVSGQNRFFEGNADFKIIRFCQGFETWLLIGWSSLVAASGAQQDIPVIPYKVNVGRRTGKELLVSQIVLR